MWLMTPIGFYSVVRKAGDQQLTVRARVAADLDRLRERYLPDLGPTQTNAGTDYPYRAKVAARSWALALADLGRDIDYANFKSEVARLQGPKRAHVYASVWSALAGLEKLPAEKKLVPASARSANPRSRTPRHQAGATVHPRKDENGNTVTIKHPSTPTPLVTWFDPNSIATVIPDGPVPDQVNGLALSGWHDAPTRIDDWASMAGRFPGLKEPEFPSVSGKRKAAGAVVAEPDGRVWVVSPTNAFGGYRHTLPKGRVDPGLSYQAAAIKEVFEETGLQIEITGFVGDFERTLTVTRYYAARRVGGTPALMGWESQAVNLAPIAALKQFLNQERDHRIVEAFLRMRE